MNSLVRKSNGNGSAVPASYSSPLDSLLSNNLSRFFDDSFWGLGSNAMSQRGQIVPVNIRETEGAYELQLAAPGMRKEDFKISINRDMLTVSFEHNDEQAKERKGEGWIRREFSSQSFSRSFSLDETVDANRITAKYTDGILNLYLPKKEEAKAISRQIEIE